MCHPWPPLTVDRFRVWIDFQGFRYANQADVYASALAALGGHLTGGPPWAADGQFAPHDRGVSNLAAWDLHISSYGPYGVATPGQLVNRLPGTVSIKFKTYLAPALVEAYGVEAAFKIMPLTFQLPLQQEQWRQWLDANPQQVRRQTATLSGLWGATDKALDSIAVKLHGADVEAC